MLKMFKWNNSSVAENVSKQLTMLKFLSFRMVIKLEWSSIVSAALSFRKLFFV